MAGGDARLVLLLTQVFPRSLDDPMGAFLLHLADALAGCGQSVEVVAPHAPGLADEDQIGAARVYRFHYAPARWERLAYTGTMHEQVASGVGPKLLFALFNLAFLAKSLSVLRHTRAAVLHAHWWLPGGLVGALTSMLTGTPLVITTHGTDVEMLRRTRWAKPLARWTFGRARAITCGSTYLRNELLALGVAEAARVSVIPMPVNSTFEGPDRDLQSPVTQSPNHLITHSVNHPVTQSILTVARLTKQKSVETLIAAVALLRERGWAVRLTIIGDGGERAALEGQAARRGLQDHVEFLGERPQAELPRYYGECAVFVLPSIREGMGLVLAEALLCGAPVIAVNSGGVTDIVKDEETGLLVPERDPVALAGAIERLLNDRALASRLAANGGAWVCEHLTRERVAEKFSEIYSHVIHG